MAPLAKLAVLLMVASLGHRTHAQWNKPYFEDPPGDVVALVPDPSSPEDTFITSFEEHTSPVLTIAIINYDGDVKPSYTAQAGSSDLSLLGIDIQRQADNKWIITSSKIQDAEIIKQYRIEVRIGATVAFLRIDVININDNSPSPPALQSGCSPIREGWTGETDCKFQITDLDGITPDQATLTIEPSSMFGLTETIAITVDTISTTLTVTKMLDYEAASGHTITVTVNDGKNVATSRIFVEVQDIADEKPVWTLPPPPVLYIDENNPQSLNYTAEDRDGEDTKSPIIYSLQEGDETLFTVTTDDAQNCILDIASIDREALGNDARLVITILAKEVNDDSSSVTHTMTIYVNDVNDNSPAITPLQLESEISEQTLGMVGDLTVTDLDLGTFGQYGVELIGESPEGAAGAFIISPRSGYQTTLFTISVGDTTLIDYEKEEWREIKLRFKAMEVSDESHFSEIPITVKLRNLNDETPKFELIEYNATISEIATAGTTVLQVTATDSDPGDKVTYTISTVLPALTIDPDTGEITTTRNNPFDYEYQQQIVFQVVATDTAEPFKHSASVQVTLNIEDVNDSKPRIELPPEDVIFEEGGSGVVTQDTTATDQDGNAELVFTILWEQTTAFSKGRKITDPALYKDCVQVTTEYVNGNKGNAIAVISTTDVLSFDYETFDVIYLRLRVEDLNTEVEGAATHEVTLPITVINTNDNAPVFNLNTEFEVRENNKDIIIGFVTATDPDELDTITYSIQAMEGTPEGLIEINAQNGELRTSKDNEIDADVLEVLELIYKVTATEQSENGKTTEQEITIKVTDLNDEKPVFRDEPTFEIKEHPEVGTTLVTVSATDNDFSDPYAKNLQYYISTALQNYYEVDINTGVVTVKDSEYLDRDTPNNGAFSIDVIVIDNSPLTPGFEMNQNSAQYSVKLQLLDENDNKPVFEPAIPAEVDENLIKEGDVVYTGVYAPDKDEPNTPFSAVTYEIVSVVPSSGEQYFKLLNIEEENKANILAATDLLGKYGTYTVNIKATDGGGESADQPFTIVVRDVNDNAPEITRPEEGQQLRVDVVQQVGERLVSKPGTPVDSILGTDKDDPSSPNGQFEVSISGDENANKYLEVQNNGQEAYLIVKALFDEGLQFFDLRLTIQDKGTPQGSNQRNARVFIINVDEVEPTFTNGNSIEINDWTENDPKVSTKLPPATDLNNQNVEESDFQLIYYYIIEGDNERVFEIKQDIVGAINTPTLKLSNESGPGLDTDDGPKQYTLKVVATNEASSPPPISLISEQSILTVQINVIDLKDSPPVFKDELYFGGISNSDITGTEITRLIAVDPDADDTLAYTIVAGSFTASEGYLEEVMNDAFTLERLTGSLRTRYIPEESSKGGFITFQAKVTDSVPNEAQTRVRVFMINDSNRVRFVFSNRAQEVDELRVEIGEILRSNLGYDCSIDTVIETNGKEGELLTSLRAIFIENESTLIEGRTVEAKALNTDTLVEMRRQFILFGLNYISPDATPIAEEDNTVQILTIVLIVVGVVLGSLVALLLVAFVLKTRSLNRRLEALSTTKFGSQESGLNRISMNVPNTNKHAIEGSNPVWNEDVPNYDNQSQNSGDSELIGVEDKPDFAYNNDNYQSSYGNFYGDVDKTDSQFDSLDTPATYL